MDTKERANPDQIVVNQMFKYHVRLDPESPISNFGFGSWPVSDSVGGLPANAILLIPTPAWPVPGLSTC